MTEQRSQDSSISLRPMAAADIDTAVSLSQAQGWPHRAEDWALHLHHGRGWVACDPEGTVIGTTLLWQFGDDTEIGSLGLIIVDPRWQGRGIGKRLWGFALIRSGGRGLWTGPVVAPSEAEAALLLSHLLADKETFVRIDIPGEARRLGQWLDSVGLPCVDRPVAMLRGEPVQHDDLMQRYGLVSQALG